MIVTAIQSFEHGRQVKRGDTLNVSSAIAAQLKEKGLVSLNGLEADTPPSAGGEGPSSASPPARRSPLTTASKSVAGAKAAAKKPAEKAVAKAAKKAATKTAK
jgi:hypothetical protein